MTTPLEFEDTFGNAEVDSIFWEMSQAIATADSETDFACATDFGPDYESAYYVRSGNVEYADIPALISSQYDQDQAFASPGDIKLVRAIFTCAGFENIYGGWPGCVIDSDFTDLYDGKFLVRDDTAYWHDLEDSLAWAHFFGRTVGLDYDGSDTAASRIMGFQGGKEITSTECLAFTSKYNPDYGASPAPERPEATPQALETAASMAPAAPTAVTTPSASTLNDDRVQASVMPVEELVRTRFGKQRYPHAVFRHQGTDAGERLVRMLEDPDDAEHWPLATLVLGFVGPASSTPDLLRFLERHDRANPGPAGHLGRILAIEGMSRLAKRFPARTEPMDALLTALDGSFWADASTAKKLRTGVFRAIALTGRPEAREILLQHRGGLLIEPIADEFLELQAELATTSLEEFARRNQMGPY
ncbi:MAG: hypothetical protein AAGA68_01485 [Pseudomonadota bacterium]